MSLTPHAGEKGPEHSRKPLPTIPRRTAIGVQCFRFSILQKESSMATGYTARQAMVTHTMVTTQFELDGFRVVKTLGVVRGIVVRSRSILGTIGASLQTIMGGNITLLTQLCEKTRAEAFDLMLQHAAELGGNAVVGARYDATEIMQGVTEVLAYGTAVLVEPVSRT
jgi:uncharacterized protein YbjQ (UPF0145 family)